MKNKKLLGIVLEFTKKLSVVVRICKFMTIERRMLMKAFIEFQFGYCPIIWMCCNRSSNYRINHLHKRRTSSIVYNDNISLFEDLLLRGQSVSIHHRNIRLLGIELYKTRHNIFRQIMNELFEHQNILYNL